MKNFVFIKMAFRFLGIGSGKTISNARKSLLGAVLGIGISLVPLVVVLVVSDGMIRGITARTIELGSGHLQLINMRPFHLNAETEKEIKQKSRTGFGNTFFENLWIERQGTGLVIGKNGRSGGTIRAIENSFFIENKKATELLKIVDGKLEFENERSAILGSKIASTLNLKVGDTCRIITLNKNKNAKIVPKVSMFKISGIISSGYQELDALWVFIPLDQGLKLLPINSSLTSILVSTSDPFNEEAMEKLRADFNNILPKVFSVYTWFDLNRSTFTSFKTTKNILLFIMFLIVLVASANISSAVIMLVMERRKEIAILKAVGVYPDSLIFAFLIAGFLTGLGGLIVGLPLGILSAIHINGIFSLLEKILNYLQNFFYSIMNTGTPLEIHILDPAYYLQDIPIGINFKELFIIALVTLLLSVIVCIIPAIHASKEKPIDIMRKI